VYQEISHALKRLRRWMRPVRVIPDLHLLPGTARIESEPYGSALILAPWNYPFQLLFSPLVAALAAGNTAAVKPSELAPATAEVARAIVEDCFEPDYVALVAGGVEESTALLALDWDHIFFTGSVPVGRIVMRAAAERLTPVTLELGGKSPCFVTASAAPRQAARRVAWGKYNNAGQTCVAPDYVLVHASVREAFLAELRSAVDEFYGGDPKSSPEYARIINDRHFGRLAALIDRERLVFGGGTDPERRYIEPSAFFPVDWDHPLMADEIFGPLLPILEYEDLEDAMRRIADRPKPLALYVFSGSRSERNRILQELPAGGACENDVVLHVASSKLPFGGVGPSASAATTAKPASTPSATRNRSINRPFGRICPWRTRTGTWP
jgi:aldehyde dehydrogenase (NAD+)